jgi:hypothetical protein
MTISLKILCFFLCALNRSEKYRMHILRPNFTQVKLRIISKLGLSISSSTHMPCLNIWTPRLIIKAIGCTQEIGRCIAPARRYIFISVLHRDLWTVSWMEPSGSYLIYSIYVDGIVVCEFISALRKKIKMFNKLPMTLRHSWSDHDFHLLSLHCCHTHNLRLFLR